MTINGTVCLAKNVQLNRDKPKSDKTDQQNCKTINGILFLKNKLLKYPELTAQFIKSSLKFVHFKNPVTRSSFLSKALSFSLTLF